MIQRSKLGLKFISPVFSTPCLSSGPVNRSDACHIAVALPAQKGCAQTISANVLKQPSLLISNVLAIDRICFPSFEFYLQICVPYFQK